MSYHFKPSNSEPVFYTNKNPNGSSNVKYGASPSVKKTQTYQQFGSYRHHPHHHQPQQQQQQHNYYMANPTLALAYLSSNYLTSSPINFQNYLNQSTTSINSIKSNASNASYNYYQQQQQQPQQQQIQNRVQQFCIRFAVNGLSKFSKGNQIPTINKNIQSGDFGDDSGMIAENSKCIVIGLADGAGGNRNIGIDPQKFSRSLLGFSVDILKNEDISPNQMARLACKSIHVLESQHIDGSGTLCLLALNKFTNNMHSLNIGDSGFRLIRQGKIVHKSNATMAGSSPKQLYVSDSSNYSGISFVTEEEILQDSDVREFQVQKGDIIVLSSDGLYDVVSDNTIEKVVNNHDEKDLQSIADELLSTSMKSYIHTQRDDILIIVCRIEPKK